MSNWAEGLAGQAAADDARIEATWNQLGADLNLVVEAIDKKVDESSPRKLSLNASPDLVQLISKNGRSASFRLDRASGFLKLTTTWGLPEAGFQLAQPGQLSPRGNAYPNLVQKAQISTSELVERVAKDVDLL